jgi:flagellar hook protein FlgE
MSLSSSLFSGISGLSTLGNSMTVIGDNIANVNTVGFKGSRVTFQDVLSQTVATVAGTSQVGRGTSLADITSSFSQGSFESTESTTDLAIGGEGFFVVRDPNDVNNQFYTRAGEFRFDKDGNFTNPAGYIVRGWTLDPSTGEDTGSITDIVLQSFTSSPKKTEELTLITNLDVDAASNVADLGAAWDGIDGNGVYIGENEYEYQSTLTAYDSLGSTHDITMYFDKGSSSTYEFIVTMNPAEDNRTGLDTTQNGVGMLGKGTLTFSQGSGAITDINFTAFDPSNTTTQIATPVVTQYNPTTPVASGTYTGTAARTYTFTVNTVGAIDGATAKMDWTDGTASGTITLDGAAQAVGAFGLSVDFGVAAEVLNAGDTFSIACYPDNDVRNTSATLWVPKSEAVSADLSNGHFFATADFLGGTNTSMDMELNFGSTYNSTTTTWANDSLSTTQYASASTTTFQASDGYGAGDLQSVTVGTDGALTGQYSNGQVIPLYRVAVAKFQNNQALFKVGGNLFRETRLSGDPTTSKPGTNGLGSISPNSLEQSNVDIANEFVKMITTQRGFQANSKIITVTDQMLQELINIKR